MVLTIDEDVHAALSRPDGCIQLSPAFAATKDGSCSSVQFTGFTKAQEAAQLIRKYIEER